MLNDRCISSIVEMSPVNDEKLPLLLSHLGTVDGGSLKGKKQP